MPYYENVFNRSHHHYTDISFLRICFVICHKSSDVPALMIILGKTNLLDCAGKKVLQSFDYCSWQREEREAYKAISRIDDGFWLSLKKDKKYILISLYFFFCISRENKIYLIFNLPIRFI